MDTFTADKAEGQERALPSTLALRHSDDDSTDTLSPAARTADDSLCPLYFNAAFEPSYNRLMKVRVVWSRAVSHCFQDQQKMQELLRLGFGTAATQNVRKIGPIFSTLLLAGCSTQCK